MSAGEPLLVLAFMDEEFGGIQVPLPGLTFADYCEARRLVQAGCEDAPVVARMLAALKRGLGSPDEWGPADDAAMWSAIRAMQDGGQSE